MKNKEVIDKLDSGKWSNPKLVDFIIEQHDINPELKATRTTYQNRLDDLKSKLKRLRKSISRKRVAEEIDKLFAEPFNFPTKGKPMPRRVRPSANSTTETQTDVTGSTSTFFKQKNNLLETRIAGKNREIKRKSAQISIDY